MSGPGRGGRPAGRRRDRDGRGTVPAVGKALEASIVVLYVGLLTAGLFGGVVPDYRASAGAELADRTLATASHEVRAAVPPNATTARTHRRVRLPATIAGEGYRIRVEGRTLVLDHPDGVGGRTGLALPDRVVRVEGAWHSRRPAAVVARSTPAGVVLRLVSGPAAERDGVENPPAPGDPPGPDPPGPEPPDPDPPVEPPGPGPEPPGPGPGPGPVGSAGPNATATAGASGGERG